MSEPLHSLATRPVARGGLQSPPARPGVLEIIRLLGEQWKNSDSGILSGHIREVLGLTPEIVRVELITFELQVAAAGGAAPGAGQLQVGTRISADYDFELTGITASFQFPGTDPANLARVTFNMREEGRNMDVFDTGPINLVNLVSTVGTGGIIQFPRGLYLFRAGAEIRPIFGAAVNGGNWAGVARTVQVMLIGNLIRKGTSQRYLQQQEPIEDDRKLNLFEIIKHLGDKWRESSQGFISSHIREVLGLPPEIIRVALIPFELLVGVATFTPPATGVRLNKDYDFELTALTAAFQNPGDNPGNMQRVTFNMRESGRNFDVFDTGPINLGNVTSTVGPGSIIEFPRGLYKFRAGSTITPDFRRAPNGGAFVGEDRTVNVLLIGNLIRSK